LVVILTNVTMIPPNISTIVVNVTLISPDIASLTVNVTIICAEPAPVLPQILAVLGNIGSFFSSVGRIPSP
jgi:hypothetical protein